MSEAQPSTAKTSGWRFLNSISLFHLFPNWLNQNKSSWVWASLRKSGSLEMGGRKMGSRRLSFGWLGKQASTDGLLAAARARREARARGRKVAWKELRSCQASAFTFHRAPLFVLMFQWKHRKVHRPQWIFTNCTHPVCNTQIKRVTATPQPTPGPISGIPSPFIYVGVTGYVLLVWVILSNTEFVAYTCRFSSLCCYTVFHLYPF